MTIAAAAPGTAVAELAERVADAAVRHERLRIVGGGTWLDANRPVAADVRLDTRALDGIVEYVPGDLTITARAATTLATLSAAVAEHGQWLALDPPGDATRATLGATIATASYGPLAHHAGTPRDLVLGAEIVTGRGEIIRGGGRVVKNVAGYDISRLVTGAWGALGVVTEATLRLRAIPPARATLSLGVDDADDALERLRVALRALPFTPLAAQLVNAALATTLGLDARGGALLLLRLGGNARALSAQRDAVAALADRRAAEEIGEEVWPRLAAVEPPGAVVVRRSARPSRFVSAWRVASDVAGSAPLWLHADPGRAVVRAIAPPASSSPAELEGASEAVAGRLLAHVVEHSLIAERLPRTAWQLVPGAASDALSRRAIAAFDPAGILNPGILGGTT